MRLVISIPTNQGGISGVREGESQGRRFNVTIAKHNIDSALVTCRSSASVPMLGDLVHVPAVEADTSNNTVPYGHHIGGSGHFGFFNRRETRVPRNKGGP